ncbi:hypothetical protein CRG98_028425, partial [Punica granatum]
MMKFILRSILLLFVSRACLIFVASTALPVDMILQTQSIRDGETIVSSGGNFELGFFSPASNSPKRYLGIWYKEISNGTVVWVANRDSPLFDSSGVVKIVDQRTLVVLNGDDQAVWSSNSSGPGLGNLIAQ